MPSQRQQTRLPLTLPAIDGQRIRLRAWQTTDTAAVREASRDDLIPLISTVSTDDAEPAALAFIHRQHDRLVTGAGYPFAIADPNDKAVGHIGLWFDGVSATRASIGYWICASQRRQGYATEALTALTGWALGLPELDRLELYVEPWNEGSWRAAEAAGFHREGLLSNWRRIGGRPRDMFLYARTAAPPS